MSERLEPPEVILFIDLFIALALIAVAVAEVASNQEFEQRAEKCAAAGGEVVTQYRSPDICVKKGTILHP